MIDWDLWHTVHELATAGSYRIAAERLGVSTTTVIRRKTALERELGRHLFLKQGGQIVPTPACSTALENHEQAAENLGEARKKLAPPHEHSHWRKLTITAVPYICDQLLGVAVARLTEDRRLRVEFWGQDRNLDLGQEREADIALRMGKLTGPNVTAVHIADVSYSTYVKQGVVAADCTWVTLDRTHSHLNEVRIPEDYAGQDGIRYTTSTTASMQRLISTGAAKGLMPDFIGGDDPQLEAIEDHPTLIRPLWLIWRSELFSEPHFQPIILWMLQEIKENLASTNALDELLEQFNS